jgi:mono/diheme cytochrome c family protein
MNVFEPFYHFLVSIGYTEPVHPPLTHFPIALVTAALIFGLLARMFKRASLATTARHCVVLAWLLFFPTVLLGYMDWQHFYHGVFLFPIKVKIGLASFLFVLLTTAMFLLLRGRGESGAMLVIYFLGFLTVGGVGYFGGRIVYESAAPPPQASTPAMEAGRKIFDTNCSSCHPGGGNIILPQYQLKGSDNLDSFDKFRGFIRDPRLDSGAKGPMPEFPPSMISDQHAQELYQYLKQEFAAPAAPGKKS